MKGHVHRGRKLLFANWVTADRELQTWKQVFPGSRLHWVTADRELQTWKQAFPGSRLVTQRTVFLVLDFYNRHTNRHRFWRKRNLRLLTFIIQVCDSKRYNVVNVDIAFNSRILRDGSSFMRDIAYIYDSTITLTLTKSRWWFPAMWTRFIQ